MDIDAIYKTIKTIKKQDDNINIDELLKLIDEYIKYKNAYISLCKYVGSTSEKCPPKCNSCVDNFTSGKVKCFECIERAYLD